MSEPLDGHIFGADQPCFGCGPRHPIGFRLSFEVEADTVVTRFTPGEQYQGPPGIMHGGLVTTLADETAVWAVIALKKQFAFTAALSGRLARPVRIGQETLCKGRITDDRRRLVDVEVTLLQRDATCFKGSFRVAVLDQSGAERLLEQPLPSEWQQFSR